jgi:hypothetical protein
MLVVGTFVKWQVDEMGTTAHTNFQAFTVHFKNVHSDRNSGCSPSRAVFEKDTVVPVCSEVSLAVTVPCLLQLSSVR